MDSAIFVFAYDLLLSIHAVTFMMLSGFCFMKLSMDSAKRSVRMSVPSRSATMISLLLVLMAVYPFYVRDIIGYWCELLKF